MPKRKLPNRRLDELYNLALNRHKLGWPADKFEAELESLVMKNAYLTDKKAKETYRDDGKRIANPQLNGWLALLRQAAEHRVASEPPGLTKRLYHVFLHYCTCAINHPDGPGATLKEIRLEA
jgi:hypothetical protein